MDLVKLRIWSFFTQRNSEIVQNYTLCENETWQRNKRGMEDFIPLDKPTTKETFLSNNN